MKKKILSVLLGVALVASLVVGCGNAEKEDVVTESNENVEDVKEEASTGLDELEPVTIVFATPNATANIESVYAEKFIELVEKNSDGKITFDYTDGGILGSQLELVEGTMNGVYNMTCTSIDNLQSWIPEISVASLPCLFDNYEHCVRVFDGEFGAKVQELAKKENIEILNYEFCGFRNICSEKSITTLEECEGVLIRTPEVDTYIAMADTLGFSYVTMSWSEAYTSMNSGIIEAVEVPLQNIYEQGFYDLGQNVLMSRHIFNTNSIMVNADFMNGLPEAYQQIIRDAAKEIETEERATCEKNENDYITKLEEKGCTINEWEEASFVEIQERFTSYWTEKADSVGGEVGEMLQMIIDSK